MTTATPTADVTTLSARFAEVFSTPATAEAVFSEDAFFDMNMPVWRFQLQGGKTFGDQIEAIKEGDVIIEVLRTVPTATGFVTEHVEHMYVDGRELTARRLWLCEVRDGSIVEATGYCSGEWDEELRARHAAEAPMLRP